MDGERADAPPPLRTWHGLVMACEAQMPQTSLHHFRGRDPVLHPPPLTCRRPRPGGLDGRHQPVREVARHRVRCRHGARQLPSPQHGGAPPPHRFRKAWRSKKKQEKRARGVFWGDGRWWELGVRLAVVNGVGTKCGRCSALEGRPASRRGSCDKCSDVQTMRLRAISPKSSLAVVYADFVRNRTGLSMESADSWRVVGG